MSTADCCFSELALINKDPTKYVGLVQSRHHHHVIDLTYSHHDMADKLLIWC